MFVSEYVCVRVYVCVLVCVGMFMCVCVVCDILGVIREVPVPDAEGVSTGECPVPVAVGVTTGEVPVPDNQLYHEVVPFLRSHHN